MTHTIAELTEKLNQLDLWEEIGKFNWAVKPLGCAYPYFCSVMREPENPEVKVRLLMLDGWQTFHDFVRTRFDTNFGIYSTPTELPHMELIIGAKGDSVVSRHDPGFVPIRTTPAQQALAARILWQTYGLMLRLESDPDLPLHFVDEHAIFARVETSKDVWEDQPLTIPPPRPHVENITLDAKLIEKAKATPMLKGAVIQLDFFLDPTLQPHVLDPRQHPRSVYRLVAADAQLGLKLFEARASLLPEGTLLKMWENLPSNLLSTLVDAKFMPAEIQVKSGRVFRFLRPLCLHFPIKLSLHDELKGLAKALKI